MATTTTDEMTDEEMLQFSSLDPPPVEPSIQSTPTPTKEHSLQESACTDQCILHRLNEILKVPEYLLWTKNKIFQQMIQQKIYPLTTVINIEELGQIAILMYQLNVFDLEKTLWTICFQSGLGILKSQESNLKVWPFWVTKMIQSEQGRTRFHKMPVNEDEDCLKFVQQFQYELNKKQQQLQGQLNLKKQQLNGFTMAIENTLQIFLQEHQQKLHLEYEFIIKLIKFDYREHVLDHNFLRENPNEQQKQLAKRLFLAKYVYEKAKAGLLTIKKETEHNQLEKSLKSVQSSFTSAIQSLIDIDQRQQLSDRQTKITQHYKNEMIILLTDIREAKLQECQKIFNDELAKMWHDQQALPIEQRLKPTMINIIDRHLSLMAEIAQCIHHYKYSPFTA